MKILFLHGKEGTPEGSKVTHLRNLGYKIIAPSLPSDDWELSRLRALHCLDAFEPDVIVGSSRGGAIATSLETNVRKILIAPAYKMFDVEQPLVDNTTTVLHSTADDIVPLKHSFELTKCGITLMVCGTCHRMKDPEALTNLVHAIEASRENR